MIGGFASDVDEVEEISPTKLGDRNVLDQSGGQVVGLRATLVSSIGKSSAINKSYHPLSLINLYLIVRGSYLSALVACYRVASGR